MPGSHQTPWKKAPSGQIHQRQLSAQLTPVNAPGSRSPLSSTPDESLIRTPATFTPRPVYSGSVTYCQRTINVPVVDGRCAVTCHQVRTPPDSEVTWPVGAPAPVTEIGTFVQVVPSVLVCR